MQNESGFSATRRLGHNRKSLLRHSRVACEQPALETLEARGDGTGCPVGRDDDREQATRA